MEIPDISGLQLQVAKRLHGVQEVGGSNPLAPTDTVISSRYGGVFYGQNKDNSKMGACVGGATRRVHRLYAIAPGDELHAACHALNVCHPIPSRRNEPATLKETWRLGRFRDGAALAQMVDDDLLREHRAHSPVDNL
jgi:hypothetical protein